jgi:hypothetical protein
MITRRLCRRFFQSGTLRENPSTRITFLNGSSRQSSDTCPTTTQIDFYTEDEKCAALQWASTPSNHQVALLCLQIPTRPISREADDFSSPSGKYQSWRDYWKNRKWVCPIHAEEDRGHGYSLATHIMTVPMTLLSAIEDLLLRTLLEDHPDEEDLHASAEARTIRWCCLGARSESGLPLEYWEEMIYLINMRISSNAGIFPMRPFRIVLDFIGPEMNTLPETTVSPYPRTTEDNVDKGFSPLLTLRWPYKGLYHKYHEEMTSKARRESNETFEEYYDAFILLNPGIGHPHLMLSWEPTLNILFRQYNTPRGCAILLTAHSELDAKRDHRLLKEYVQKFEIDVRHYWTPYYRYDPNPFASRIKYIDPIDRRDQKSMKKPHVVRPNHYRAIFPRLRHVKE